MGICCCLLDLQINSKKPVMLWGRRTSLIANVGRSRHGALEPTVRVGCLPPFRKVRERMGHPGKKAILLWGWISPIIGIRTVSGLGP
jgi:hypothetical protein